MHYREILFTPRCSARVREFRESVDFSVYDVQLRSYGASNLPNFRILAFVGGTCVRSTECPSSLYTIRAKLSFFHLFILQWIVLNNFENSMSHGLLVGSFTYAERANARLFHSKMLKKYSESDMDFIWFTGKNLQELCFKIHRIIMSMHRLCQHRNRLHGCNCGVCCGHVRLLASHYGRVQIGENKHNIHRSWGKNQWRILPWCAPDLAASLLSNQISNQMRYL